MANRSDTEPGPTAPRLRRLGLNKDSYAGETIDIRVVLEDCVTAARAAGWAIGHIPCAPQPDLLAFTREAQAGAARPFRLYISSGIHGDEPAGPLAVRQMLQEDRWPPGASLWMCPCLNPTGFIANSRANSRGYDLNRQYLEPKAEEIAAHSQWLLRQPRFDLSLCLHEDWESHGFYLYELNPKNRPSPARRMIQAVESVCPIDRSPMIEGRPAEGGIVRPVAETHARKDWPEAFFLISHKTDLSYTLEAPSDFPLSPRVAALVAGVNAAITEFP